MVAETPVLLLPAGRIGLTSHLPLELVVRTKYNNYIKLLVKQSRQLSSCVYFFSHCLICLLKNLWVQLK